MGRKIIDEPLAIKQKGRVYYYHADGLGSITALTDQRGRIVQRYEYDSFGNMKHRGHKVKQPYTFTGREWDVEIELYYYRARYYDPKVGRFISFDPFLHKNISCKMSSLFYRQLQRPQRLNPYIYVVNNPINRIDPSGLVDIPEKLYGEIISEILTIVIEKTIGGITGAVCASRYCKRHAIPQNWFYAFSECGSIWADYPELPTGIFSTEEYVSACADECFRITHTEKFKKICCIQ